MLSAFRWRILPVLALFAFAGVLSADDSKADEAVKAYVGQLEQKAKDAIVRAVRLEEQADRAKSAVEKTRLLKEAKTAREEANDARQAVRYTEARHLESKFNPVAQRAMSLLEQASKATTEEDRLKFGNAANAARSEAIDIQKKVRQAMDELAPSDRMGYGPAHIWQADGLIRAQQTSDGRMVPPTRGQLLQAERHLTQAAESADPDVKLSAQIGMARICYETDRLTEAKALMARVAEAKPEYHMVLAQWANKEGQKAAVATHAKAAAEEFQNRIKARADDHASRFGYVDCLVMMGEFDAAKEFLTQSALKFEQPEVRRLYLSKSSSVALLQLDARGKDVPLSERLQRLDEALRVDPNNPDVYNRLQAMVQAGGETADQVREAMLKLTSDEKRAAMAHLFLGLDAWQRKDGLKAREHWDQSLKLTNGSPILANNLAWNLANTQPFDLPRALVLVNEALQKVPNEGRFKSTRGHILVKLERYREALPDLLAATQVYPNDANLFRLLSDVLTKLGDKRKADEFTKRAAMIAAAEKKAASEKPKSP